ncbi:peptidylprolyl isomerase [Clostridium thailandense]|uniref:Foldase protein PrsA n=1 Tax=Clostridium thailandense TaxID=2794346 RepID=A0A949TVQ3_9CLOT|nr:peptidylprolyl isomerase [Clostridium thailandense]MBV7273323.1 peptidylprolyl isomerase [Clostridium thailandense]MCH5137348.1 peptidylprolyl isomerase [Clostridiaceae bacterium UIB06]
MKNIKKIVSAALITMLGFSAVGCNMIAKTPEAIAKSAVAEVNGEKITRSDLDNNIQMKQVIAQVKQQYGENYEKNDEAKSTLKDQRTKVLDTMITEKVIEQKAKELKVLPDDSKLKDQASKQLDDIKKQQFGNDDTKFQDMLKQQGFTVDSAKQLIFDQLKESQIQKNISDYLAKDIKIDDKKIQDYYKANQTKYTEKPDTIHLAHILVKTEDEAKKVKERLDKGEDFAKVAKEVSQDPGSKDKGGDLGTVNYVNSGMDATFMAAALALKEGTISAPVKTQFGYHIIKSIKKTEYPVKKLETVKDQIKQELLEQEKSTLVSQKTSEWQKAAKITKYEKNLL